MSKAIKPELVFSYTQDVLITEHSEFFKDGYDKYLRIQARIKNSKGSFVVNVSSKIIKEKDYELNRERLHDELTKFAWEQYNYLVAGGKIQQ